MEKLEEHKVLVDSGKMTKEEFIAKAFTEPGYPLCPFSPVVKLAMG